MALTTRAAATTSAVAAAAFVAAGATVVGHTIPDEHWGTRGAVLDIAFAIGLLAVAWTLPMLAARLQARRLGRIGTRLAQAGQVAMAVESIASTIHGGSTLGPVFALGLLASFVGFAALAVDGFRGGHGRTLALAPLVGFLVGIAAGNQGGAIALGVVWAAIAVVFDRDEPASASVPAA